MTINHYHNRRNKNFLNRKVSEALPEHFTSDYSKFITFLEKYYQQLDSDASTSFGNEIRQLFSLRDAGSTNRINNLISDVGSGIPNGDNFTDARYAARRLAELQRNKGTKFAIEEFFRLFFQDKITVEYGKDNLFIVGAGDSNVPASLIGPDSLKVLQNGKLYQVFSILIKTALSSNTWEELYKKFIHPAGFYFQGLVTSDAEATVASSARGFYDDFDSGVIPIISSASLTAQAPFTQVTGLIDSGNNSTNDFRVGLDQLISVYQNLTPSQIDQFYGSAAELITPSSFTFDDSDSAGGIRPDISLATETMDNEIFGNYLIDSTF
tara:strand:- start:12159 stop:13130 length:972 start_codon:yes stop_codon:yes gene_type:complete